MKKKTIIVGVIVPIVAAVIGGVIGQRAESRNIINRVENTIANVTGDNANVTINDIGDFLEEYENTKNRSSELEKLNNELKEECSEYKQELQDKQVVVYYDPTLVKDSIPIPCNSPNNVAYINDRLYISEQAISLLCDKPIKYSRPDNILFSNDLEEDTSIMVNLLDTNILYDGENYTIYKPSNGNSFSIGGVKYTSGFDINTSGGNQGYVLFNLNNEYSLISFDTGRIDGTDKQDITLDVFLNDEFYETYNISSDTPITHIEIPLNYASNMKLYFHVTYSAWESLGFTNIYLKK